MKKHVLASAAVTCNLLAVFAAVSAASLVLGYEDSSGGGVTLTYPSAQPSVGGPGPALEQAALHGSAPVAISSMLIDRMMLALLLVCIGYALHAFMTDHERHAKAHASTHRRKHARKRTA